MKAFVEEKKPGAPPWMVSFGDMMTLILTFFILLVSLSSTQSEGLVAQGIGSFVISLRSFGLPGILSDEEKATVFEDVRQRFNLPPEPDPERRAEHDLAAQLELIRANDVAALAPHYEIAQPTVAAFEVGSAELTPSSRDYLDLLAPTLRPARGETLVLEGHADPGEAPEDGGRWLAQRRALAVRAHLLEEHGFRAERVVARAWAAEIEGSGPALRAVDARLVEPDLSR